MPRPHDDLIDIASCIKFGEWLSLQFKVNIDCIGEDLVSTESQGWADYEIWLEIPYNPYYQYFNLEYVTRINPIATGDFVERFADELLEVRGSVEVQGLYASVKHLPALAELLGFSCPRFVAGPAVTSLRSFEPHDWFFITSRDDHTLYPVNRKTGLVQVNDEVRIPIESFIETYFGSSSASDIHSEIPTKILSDRTKKAYAVAPSEDLTELTGFSDAIRFKFRTPCEDRTYSWLAQQCKRTRH